MSLRRLLASLYGMFAIGGCSSAIKESLPLNQPGSFELVEVESETTADGTLKTWRATSRTSDARPFTFRVEMLLKSPRADMPFAFSLGAFIREPSADGTQFIKEVARAIEAEGDPPSSPDRVDRLEFSTAILGTGLSRLAGDDVIGGSFTSTKPGNWIAFKLFLGDGEGEVYLNIDPVAGQGEFTMKDPECGEVVIRELARVFLP